MSLEDVRIARLQINPPKSKLEGAKAKGEIDLGSKENEVKPNIKGNTDSDVKAKDKRL